MTRALADAHRYPSAGALAEKLAAIHDVDPDWIILGAGSTELLRNIPPAFARDGQIVTAREAYRSVPMAAQRLGIPCRLVPVDAELKHDLAAMARAITRRTRVVVVCNPNNPTGTVLPAVALQQFAGAVPRRAVYVVDEAYVDFTPEAAVTAMSKACRNVLLLRTFSKAHGLAGVRVGYGLGHPDLIRRLRKHALAYSVSLVACAGALAALEDAEHVQSTRAHARNCRTFFDQALAPLGRRYVPGDTTSFLLEAGEHGDAFAKRLAALGVFVHSAAGWGLPTYVRVSYGTMADNEALVVALRRVLRPAA